MNSRAFSQSEESERFDDPLLQDQELWDLLGGAKSVSISPFFARNVIREIRVSQEPAQSPVSLFFRQWRAAIVAVVTLCIVAANALVLLQDNDGNSTAQRSGDPDQATNLAEFLGNEAPTGWLDLSSR